MLIVEYVSDTRKFICFHFPYIQKGWASIPMFAMHVGHGYCKAYTTNKDEQQI